MFEIFKNLMIKIKKSFDLKQKISIGNKTIFLCFKTKKKNKFSKMKILAYLFGFAFVGLILLVEANLILKTGGKKHKDL